MIDFSFPHSWHAEVLPQRPAILPARHFTYPREAEEAERGALEVSVRPVSGAPFLATLVLGFADPAAPSGLWSCPNPHEICAVSGGYAYLVDTRDPRRFTQLPFRPVMEVRPLRDLRLLLFASHHALMAWGTNGEAWATGRLSAEGLRIADIRGDTLHGFGWDLQTARELPFAIDLRSGRRLGSEPALSSRPASAVSATAPRAASAAPPPPTPRPE